MAELQTADGFCWQFYGTNEDSDLLILGLVHAMQLSRQATAVSTIKKIRQIRKILVSVAQKETCWKDMPVENASEISCLVGPVSTPKKTAWQLMRLSQIVANASEKNGGLLVHGALAVWNGTGVIFAGPGGVGKTTASQRLPRSWRSLSDDTTLIVKAADGMYWAHPWPTWSRYRTGDLSGSWDVQAAVKLGLICMLARDKKDRTSHLSNRQVISELVDVSGQTFFIMANGMDKGAIRRINLMRFYNAVAISNTIPVCRLEISRNGEFWKEIERFLSTLKKNCKIKK